VQLNPEDNNASTQRPGISRKLKITTPWTSLDGRHSLTLDPLPASMSATPIQHFMNKATENLLTFLGTEKY
jgi:hypothetical protein